VFIYFNDLVDDFDIAIYSKGEGDN